jgi:hypothetical protein
MSQNTFCNMYVLKDWTFRTLDIWEQLLRVMLLFFAVLRSGENYILPSVRNMQMCTSHAPFLHVFLFLLHVFYTFSFSFTFIFLNFFQPFLANFRVFRPFTFFTFFRPNDIGRYSSHLGGGYNLQ